VTAAAAKHKLTCYSSAWKHLPLATAEAVFRRLAPKLAPELEFQIDSAGTHGYHIGAAPDERSQRAALNHASTCRAARTPARTRDFDRFDWIVFMDETNRRDALKLSYRERGRGSCGCWILRRPAAARRAGSLLRPNRGFCTVVGLIDTGVRGFIAALRGRQPIADGSPDGSPNAAPGFASGSAGGRLPNRTLLGLHRLHQLVEGLIEFGDTSSSSCCVMASRLIPSFGSSSNTARA